MEARLRLHSRGGRPHTCSAFSLLIEENSPIIIFDARCWIESNFMLDVADAGDHIGAAYSNNCLMIKQYTFFRVLDIDYHVVPQSFLSKFNFPSALLEVCSMCLEKQSSGSKVTPR